MATAKKLPSGSWRCQVFSHIETSIDSKTGKKKDKRIYKSFTSDVPGPKGKRLAEQMAAQWAAEKENATSVQNLTLGEAIDRYTDERLSLLSPRTVMDYRRTRKKDMQELMNQKVPTLTQEQVQVAINAFAANHAPKTVRNAHGLIAAVLGVYRPNFALNTKLPEKVRPKIYVPTDAEIQRLMECAKGTELEIPILLAAFGPMRRGEIGALTSDDISGNMVHITKNMVLNTERQWIIKTPKSYAGDRYIDFPDFVIEKIKGKKGRIVSLDPNQITRKFHDLLKKNKMELFRFHDLRHPYVKHTTKIFSLRLMDFQAQAYPDARRKTRGACQLLRVGQSRSPVRPLCNRKRFSCLPPQSKMSWILYAISMRLSGYTSTRSISSSASSVVSVSASKIALDAFLRLSCRACSSCFFFACANTAA